MKSFIILFCLLVTGFYCSSQGCSDPGFCSLGALKNHSDINKHQHTISIGMNYGLGEQHTSTINPYLEYVIVLHQKWSLQGKITSTYASGFLGNNLNIGDIYGLASYRAINTSVKSLLLLSGIKIPLTVSNDKYQGKPLPLDYQSSIGTYDYIGGISYSINKKWEFSTGVQIPVKQINKNTFFPDEYSDVKTMNFAPTNNFRRKSDALLRAGYVFNLKHSITLKPNVLAIYHLGEDTYENRMGVSQKISGSSGLTVNAGASITKKFTNNHQLEIILATPLVVREVRADGLTRSAVFNIQYSFNF